MNKTVLRNSEKRNFIMASWRTCVTFAVCILMVLCVWCVIAEDVYTHHFALIVRGGQGTADRLAEKYGYTNHGQIGALEDHYLFSHQNVFKRSAMASTGTHTDISDEPEVEWFEQQVSRKRVKRKRTQLHSFSDPLWSKQWYLDGNFTGDSRPTVSMNIQQAWDMGYTGAGVVITIMDDGLEYTHTDIMDRYDANASYDFVSHDADPMPVYKTLPEPEENMHGTRCAGEIVMQPNNSKCGVGIAYNAHIGGIRMLDGLVTDAMEASSLSFNLQHVDIYSASWGPEDGGFTVEGPGSLAKKALSQGVVKGRDGKGSIFVWASGNGGEHFDDCNADGYANSMFTLVVSSTTENQDKPFYSEHCSASLASTFSSGNKNQKMVVTTDLHDQCIGNFSGTSASAPIAAGIVSLVLEANGNLTWRDVQYLVVITSKRHQLTGEWITNGAGYEVSHWFGYGLMDAAAMVERARTWENLPQQLTCSIFANNVRQQKSRFFSFGQNDFTSDLEVTSCKDPFSKEVIQHLEHVQVTLLLGANRRGKVQVQLTSPSGTTSTLLSTRANDQNGGGFKYWTLMSVHFWGENPVGTWKIKIGNGLYNGLKVKLVRLTLRGSSSLPASLSSSPVTNVMAHEEIEQEGGEGHEEIEQEGGEGHEEIEQEDGEGHEEIEQEGGEGEAEGEGLQQELLVEPQSPSDRRPQVSPLRVVSETVHRDVRAASPSEFSWDSSWWWSSSDWESFQQCHEECLYGCSGPNADDCYKCRHYKDRVTLECVATCPDGQFTPPELHIRCGRCSEHCKTCSGNSRTNCLSCTQGLFLSDNNACVQECGNGYYRDTFFQMCRQCSPLCKSCEGNENQCTSCVNGAVLRGSQCITRCMDSEYMENERCHPCHLSCYSCNGGTETDCTSCFDDYVHMDMKCVRPDQCGLGYYIVNSFDAESRQCLRCHSTCKDCQGPSFTDCVDCHQGFFLVGGACLQTCENGKFLADDGNCRSCSDGCIMCVDQDTCIQCAASKVLHRIEDGNVVCREGCQDGKYSMEGECFSCHSTCETCSGGGIMDCTRCKQPASGTPAKYLLEGACVSYCPAGYFMYERGDSSLIHTCELCDDSCKTCSGFGVDQCTECEDGLVKTDQRCVEPSDFQCTVQDCDECLNGNPDVCLTCMNGYFLDGGACGLTCPDGKFPVANTRLCELCHPTCKTCEISADWCLSCNSGYFYDEMDHLCLTQCPEDTYVDDHQCIECDDKCASCVGPTADDCTICYEMDEFLSGTSCVTHCSAGQYGDEYTGTCRSCHPSCVTCAGPGDHECNSCRSNFDLELGFCRSSCTDRFYKDAGGNCQPCDNTCQTCTGDGPQNCLSCNYYEFLSPDNACLTDCPQYYYPDYESNVCRRCDPSCETCLDSGPGDCIECSSETYMLLRDGQLCVEICPEGYYNSTELGFRDCRQCSVECRDCHGTYLNCISCFDGTYLFQGRCFSTCPSGYIEDDETNHCIQHANICPLYCDECDDWGDCTVCQDDFIVYFGECVREQDMACHINEFIMSFNPDGTAQCGSCDSSCGTCLGPANTDCVTCASDQYHFQGSRCVQECESGKYRDVVLKQCYECHPTCLTCDAGSPSDCTSCIDGMQLSKSGRGMCQFGCPTGQYLTGSGVCAPCNDVNCFTCYSTEDNQNICLSCKLGYLLTGTGDCVVNCPVNTYEYLLDDAMEGNECRPCHESCASCNGPGPTSCTSCLDDMVLVRGECSWDCEEGYYPDEDDRCQRCHETCQTCFGGEATDCMSCRIDKVLLGNSCVEECGDGYFVMLDGIALCQECDTSCFNCHDYGPFDCTSCHPNYELDNGVCYNKCGSGRYYIKEKGPNVQTCGVCDDKCAECFGPAPDQCISCKGNLRLEKMDRNNSQCIPCCSTAQDGEECCEKCEQDSHKCPKPYVNNPPTVGGVKVDHVGTIVFSVMLVIVLFFVVFGLLQARSHGKLCWSHKYAKVPSMNYNSKDKYVTLGKPDDDYYEDEEDIYGDVSDEDEDDLEEPDTFQTVGVGYRGQDRNGVIDHL